VNGNSLDAMDDRSGGAEGQVQKISARKLHSIISSARASTFHATFLRAARRIERSFCTVFHAFPRRRTGRKPGTYRSEQGAGTDVEP
jgi:hypothetical protein